MWNIWTSGNKFIFEGTPPLSDYVIIVVFAQLQLAKEAFGDHYFPPPWQFR